MRLAPLIILLLLALAAHAQQERVAILNTVDDGEPPAGHLELSHLTDKFREAANNVLPRPFLVRRNAPQRYAIRQAAWWRWVER